MSQGGPLAGMAPELQAQLLALAAGPTPNEQPQKQPVRVASTATLTLSGEQTIDGVAAVAGDRVLAKDQTDNTHNGIYVIQPLGAWTRSLDANADDEWEPGTLVPVIAGTLGAGSVWMCTSTAPIIIGTSSLTFEQSSGQVGGAPVNVTKAAAAEGTSATSSRSDHKHDITTAVVGQITVTTAAEGSASSLARSDHAHSVSTAAPSSLGGANAEGSATSLARSDHVHNYDTATFGDGSDGDGAITVNSTETTAKNWANLTISPGVTYTVANAHVFVNGTITGDATTLIVNNGGNASGSTGGTAAGPGSLVGGLSGPSGDADAGSAGSDSDCSFGGDGGAGGLGAGGAGGAGGDNNAPLGDIAAYRNLVMPTIGLGVTAGGVVYLEGGASGGAGGGDGSGKEGGGGGAGAGRIYIAAKVWSFAGTITATGGNGGNGVGAGNSGGGGGGGGGHITRIYRSQTVAPAAVTAAGGAGGAKTGTGVAGSAGATGTVVPLRA